MRVRRTPFADLRVLNAVDRIVQVMTVIALLGLACTLVFGGCFAKGTRSCHEEAAEILRTVACDNGITQNAKCIDLATELHRSCVHQVMEAPVGAGLRQETPAPPHDADETTGATDRQAPPATDRAEPISL